MKKSLRQLFCLMLAAIMLSGMLVNASAAEVEAVEETTAVTEVVETEAVETEPATEPVEIEETEAAETEAATEPVAEETAAATEPSGVKEIFEEVEMTIRDEAGKAVIQQAEGVYSFSSYEDLKRLISWSYGSYTYAYYDGTGPVTITESITIPDNLYVEVYSERIIIPAGVTVTVGEWSGLYAAALDVHGTLNTSNSYAEYELNVTGTVNCTGSIYVGMEGTVTGEEKINFTEEAWTDRLWVSCDVTDMASLKYAVEKARAGMSKEYFYEIYNYSDTPIVINESMVMPWNVRLYVNAQMTVAPGVTLHLDGAVPMLNAPLVVQGTLINDQVMNIYPEDGGKVVIENGGSYSGTGSFYVWGQSLADPWGAFAGIDVAGYTIEYYNDYGTAWLFEYPQCETHVMGDWYYTEEPTCTEGGIERRDCVNCGRYYESRGVEATGHIYANDQESKCSNCDFRRVVESNVPVPKGTTPMYRLYNPNTGEHFYTGSEEERDVLNAAGWHYEGISWYAPIHEGEPVYRMCNPNNSDHHYTMSAEEKENLETVGWRYEGVCWNSASSVDGIPLYRLYNPNADCGSHHYTGSVEERENLVDVGWLYEGISWYGIP